MKTLLWAVFLTEVICHVLKTTSLSGPTSQILKRLEPTLAPLNSKIAAPYLTVRSQNIYSDTHKISNRVRHYIWRLRKLLHGRSINNLRIDDNIDKFRKELAVLEAWADTVGQTAKISAEIKFARLMFDTMVEIVAKLQKYKVSQEPGAALVCDMLELRVKILVLFNSDGLLDNRTRNVEKKVLILWQMLKSTEYKFDGLKNVLEDFHCEFKKQVVQAEQSLQLLLNQIPGYAR